MGGLLLRSCLFLFAGDNIQTLYPDLLVNIYVLFFGSRGEFMTQLRSDDQARGRTGVQWSTMLVHHFPVSTSLSSLIA